MTTSSVKNNIEPSAAKKSNNEEDEAISTKFDGVDYLPMEIVQKILFNLSAEDLRSATSCCTSWNAAVQNDYFWKKLCLRDDYFEVEESKRSDFYTNFLQKYNYWQGVYWYNYTLQRNWENNNYKELNYEIMEPRDNHRWWLFENAFVSVNDDKTKLYIYNLKTTEFTPIVISMRADVDFINGKMLASENYLIYLNPKKSLTVWDLENGSTVIYELWNHVTNIHAYKDLILLESWKAKFEVFNMESRQIEYELKGIFTNVSFIDGRILYTTMDDVINILQWDDKSLVSLTCCNVDMDGKHKLWVKNNYLLSFCRTLEEDDYFPDANLCIWNIATKTKLHSKDLGNTTNIADAFLINEKYFCAKYSFINNDYCNPAFCDDYDDCYRDHDQHCYCTIELFNYTNGSHTTEDWVDNPVNSRYIDQSCYKISNDHIMITTHSSELCALGLREKYIIFDLNDIVPTECECCTFFIGNERDVIVTKSKLICVMKHVCFEQKMQSACTLLLHIRDYEI